MSTPFELPSLHLGTAFDRPAKRHELPVYLDQDVPGAVALIDGAVRAPHRLARVVRPSGMLGLSLVRPAGPITVHLDIRIDGLSNEMWHDNMLGSRAKMDRSADKDREVPLPDVSGRHRLLRFTAQGRTVAGAALGLRRYDGEATVEQVSFQVTPDQLGDDGLLMIGMESSRADEQVWPTGAAMQDGVVGIAVARAHLRLGSETIDPRVAVGRHDDQGALVLGQSGILVVNPGLPDTGTELEVGVRSVGGDRLRGRRARVKHPGRAVREFAEDRVVDKTHGIGIAVRTLDGADVPGAEVDGNRLRLPAGTGPVMVRLTKRTPSGEPSLVDWSVRSRSLR